ncbi:QRFP-like peptide receptor [Mya arenaria]|uniref:QRFP-like peptide receptor n=1 Tax=Mya arenaria TaxID=6604 RepID=UPI0022E6EE93|nr:QRFP-like peptide receptor [Mya arenaria]
MDAEYENISIEISNETFDGDFYLGLKSDTTTDRTFKIIFYSILMMFGIFGNLSVVLVICKSKQLRTKFNFYIVNLAVADFFMAVFCTWIHLVSSLHPEQWTLGKLICKTHNFVQVTTVCCSVFTLTTVIIDRFIAVVSPGCLWITQKCQPVNAVIIWLLSFAVATPWLIFQYYAAFDWIGGHEVVCQSKFPSALSKKAYYVSFFVLVFLFPVLLMFSLLVVAVIKSNTVRPNGTLATECFKRAQRKAHFLLLTVLIMFCVSWAPQQSLLLWDIYRDIHEKPPGIKTVHFVALYLAYSSSAVNPILYFVFNKCARASLWNIVTCRRNRSAVAVHPEPSPHHQDV